ncbi:DNA-directed RNA polymerase subunit beta [bacterium HR15]|nr:DNA-directed RNA polymerase subunit beta [bacterium HR15]
MRIIRPKTKRIRTVLEPPALLEIQFNSYRWFLEQGLKELFEIFSPIYDLTDTYFIEFDEYCLGEPKYALDECREREMTFEAPLRVKVRYGKKDGEIQESEIYLGDLPLMTDSATFIINGRERVVINQLNRTPGVHFPSPYLSSTGREMMARALQEVYLVQIIPAEGPWIDGGSDPHDVVRVRIHQSKQLPFTQIIKALAAFPEARVPTRLTLERAVGWRLLEPIAVRRKTLLEPGTLLDADTLNALPDEIRQQKVLVEPPYLPDAEGRLGLNQEAFLWLFGTVEEVSEPTIEQLKDRYAAEEIRDRRGRVLVERGARLDTELAALVARSVNGPLRVIRLPRMVQATLEADPTSDSREALVDFYRRMRPGDPAVEENVRNVFYNLLLDRRRYDLGAVGRYQINRKLGHETPLHVRHLTVPDLILTLQYLIELADEKHDYDDTDHLANKRVRSVGEQLQAHLRAAFLRMEKIAREKMTAAEDVHQLLPNMVLSVKPVSAALKSFFAQNPLSTFMDQTNPLSEVANKRRLSVLGPGGLGRQSVPPQVRNIFPSHYGRLCPVETPEGQNIGLVNQLTLYARVDEYGFIRSPYRVVRNGRVTDEVVYLAADEEMTARIAPADTPLLEDGTISTEMVQVRLGDEYPTIPRDKVDYMDVSPSQVFSVSASMIPFLEHDDAGRALMGANMQRQAVPLIEPEIALVHTGVERTVALSAPSVVRAQRNGRVRYVSADEIRVETDNGTLDIYRLKHLQESNKGTTFSYRPAVRLGQRVRAGDILANGASTQHGELALGRNVLVAFMPWNGYNYEDAVLVSQGLLYNETYTSIHLETYQTDAVDTKLGSEEITADIPNVGEEARRHLDENGIIRLGAEVRPEDILVGKVAPKAPTEGSPEQRLVRIIFGSQAEEMRDVSLRLPHGERGIVVQVLQFARYRYQCERCNALFYRAKPMEGRSCPRCRGALQPLPEDELPPGVNHRVRVTIATKRLLTEGDKMAGRHGNKGVISRIQPVEDMPFLMDGTPVEVVLNPLGVPSRMNVGQILELHLGYAARTLGVRYQTPVFQGATVEEVQEELKAVADRLRLRALESLLTDELRLALAFPPGCTFEQALQQVQTHLQTLSTVQLEWLARRLGVHTGAPASQEETKPTQTRRGRPKKSQATEKAPDLQPLVAALTETMRERAIHRSGFDPATGKAILRDGHTGEPFQNPVAIGYLYLLKLEHLAEEKIHARSIGPYSLVTQQPLGGKAQFGGQRLGEMEVWALEAYGAAHTLQEMLTIKSDDVMGRIRAYEAIVKGAPVIQPSIPESFKILVNELRALALRVQIIDSHDVPHDFRSLEELETLDIEAASKPTIATVAPAEGE